ncbi:MAG: hypothetical protein JW751_00985 [Polyangiaceae bacterium]|nr:hypothetical protein [Polyangiaceae bacterium]
MSLRRLIVIGLVNGIVGLGQPTTAPAEPGDPVSTRSSASEQDEWALLTSRASVEILGAALALSQGEGRATARRVLIGRAETEVKLVRRSLARTVDRARLGGDKARAAELGRINVELGRLERELRLLVESGDGEAGRAAVESSIRYADTVRGLLARAAGMPTVRVLGFAVWMVGKDGSLERGALTRKLGPSLLHAAEMADPPPSPEVVARCREAWARATSSTPPPDEAAWESLVRVAAELAMTP